MKVYEDNNLVAKPSRIHGTGLFAKRDFKKGELVVEWNPVKLIPKAEASQITPEEKEFASLIDENTYAIVGVPGRFVNHSAEPNIESKNGKDYAVRDIAAGEEILADYRAEGALNEFLK